jgi:hypothetical protein
MAELYSGWDSHGIATLYAHWGVDPIAPPPGFDLEAFTAVPQLTDAADVQQVAGECALVLVSPASPALFAHRHLVGLNRVDAMRSARSCGARMSSSLHSCSL